MKQAKKIFLVNIENAITLRACKVLIDEWHREQYKESWTQKTLEINLSSSSLSLLPNAPYLYHPFSDFSSLFHSFAFSFSNLKIAPLSKYTKHIFKYVDCYRSENIYQMVNMERFKKMTKGYLHLKLSESNNIVKEEKAPGIMLDTTWKLLQHYVVSIPTIIIHNVGAPLGYSFALIEDSQIENDFFNKFQNVHGFSISYFIDTAESDQGTGLLKSIRDQNMKHLSCLRHLLVTLKHKKIFFSSQQTRFCIKY